MNDKRRLLPILPGPTIIVGLRAARMLAFCWPVLERAYREAGGRVPDELVEVLEACREAANRWPPSAGGSALDAEAEVATGSGHGEITTSEAAQRLGIGERAVRLRIRSGRLRARKVGAAWLVDASSIEDDRAGRAAAG